MPIFTSFDDAWRWFMDGGELEPVAVRREHFTAGRAQFIAFQAPLAGSPVADEIAAVQDEIADIAGLDLMSRDALHISVRGVGFQVIEKRRPDDVLREDVRQLAELAGPALHGTAPVMLAIGPAGVFPDAVILEVHDGGRLGEVRARLAPAEEADAFGLRAPQYLPHVTIATFLDAGAAAALRERLPALRERPPARVTVRRIELARWWFTGADPSEEPERETVRSYALRG